MQPREESAEPYASQRFPDSTRVWSAGADPGGHPKKAAPSQAQAAAQTPEPQPASPSPCPGHCVLRVPNPPCSGALGSSSVPTGSLPALAVGGWAVGQHAPCCPAVRPPWLPPEGCHPPLCSLSTPQSHHRLGGSHILPSPCWCGQQHPSSWGRVAHPLGWTQPSRGATPCLAQSAAQPRSAPKPSDFLPRAPLVQSVTCGHPQGSCRWRGQGPQTIQLGTSPTSWALSALDSSNPWPVCAQKRAASSGAKAGSLQTSWRAALFRGPTVSSVHVVKPPTTSSRTGSELWEFILEAKQAHQPRRCPWLSLPTAAPAQQKQA